MSSKVQIYVYDVTRGLAAQMSSILLGHHIDGVWHTGVVCFGREHFFGSCGIDSIRPGTTVLGAPTKTIDLGETYLTSDVFHEYLFTIGNDQFRPEKYNLFHHNCNTFSNELAQFLTGKKIPAYILDLPGNVLNTPLGSMLQSFMEGIGGPAGGSGSASNSRNAPAQYPAPLQNHRNEAKSKPNVEKARQPLTFNSEVSESLGKLRKTLTNKEKELGTIEECIIEKNGLEDRLNDVIDDLRDVIDSVQESKEQSHMESFLDVLSNISLRIPLQIVKSPKGSLLIKDALLAVGREKYDRLLSSSMKISTNLCSDEETRTILVSAKADVTGEVYSEMKSLCLECFHGDYTKVTQDNAITFLYNLSLSKIDEETEIELAAALVHWLDGNHETESGKKCIIILKSWMNNNDQVKDLVEMTMELSNVE